MQTEINTSNLLQGISRYKKTLALFVVLTTVAGTITCLLLPKKYRSATIVAPTNPRLVDKSFIYGKQVLEPQSVYGMEEDLDRTLANFKLYSNFGKLVDSFQLIKHYDISSQTKGRAYATEALIDNCSIIKTAHGAIEIAVWDKDKGLAADIANALVAVVQEKIMQQNLQVNKQYIADLEKSIAAKQQQLSMAAVQADVNQRLVLTEALSNDMAAVEQMKLSLTNNATALVVMDKAYPSDIHDTPKLRYWIAASLLGSLAFGILLIALATAIGYKNA
jgi:LPS O-antigen subunit length determinant protein (WzzB/FepE family)